MDYFIYEVFFVILMVTTKLKSRIQSQNIKRGESEDITIEKHQFTQVDRNRGKKGTIEIQNNQKANDKMAVVRPYISIITLDRKSVV